SELRGGQRAIQVSPALRDVCGDVVAPEDHLERTRPADEPRQALRTAPARQDAEGHLRLGEHGTPERAEAEVEREQELAATAARPALDLPDRRLRHGPEALDHRVEEAERGRLRHVRSEEHTSELQSRFDLVCRLLLEKK